MNMHRLEGFGGKKNHFPKCFTAGICWGHVAMSNGLARSQRKAGSGWERGWAVLGRGQPRGQFYSLSGDKDPGNVRFVSLSKKIGSIWMQKASRPLLTGLSAGPRAGG